MEKYDVDIIDSALTKIKYLESKDYAYSVDFVFDCYEHSRVLNEACRNFILKCMREVNSYED